MVLCISRMLLMVKQCPFYFANNPNYLITSNFKKEPKTKSLVPKTLKMQWMLFKTFCLSIVSAVMLLLVPVILLAILGVARVHAYAAPITNILQVVMAFHSIIDYTILMYFILPYRKFCIKCFQRVFFFLKFKKQNQILVKSVATGTGLNKHN